MMKDMKPSMQTSVSLATHLALLKEIGGEIERGIDRQNETE